MVIHISPLPAHAAAPLPGTISTYAGGPGAGPATTVAQGPWGLALTGSTLYIADPDHSVVRALNTTTGAETILAGNGISGDTGDGGPATAAGIAPPTGLAVDGVGNLYIDTGTRIRKVTPLGVISTYAGGGSSGLGDGGLATNATISAWGVAVDGAGNVFIADTFNNRIREVDHTTGIITTVAGTGVQGFGGDGGPATSAQFTYPEDIWVDGSGNLWIADGQNNRIREVVAGTINTVAGNGTAGTTGDGGPATSAELWEPRGVWVDGAGHLFIADQYNARIREVSGGIITTVAGNGTGGFSGDGGAATSAELNRPMHALADGSGNLFIADYGNMRVRKVSGGNISTVAGTGGSCGRAGDGGAATSATLCNPSAVALDTSGDLFIADTGNNVVREVTPAGVISTFAGNGVQGSSGDTGPATSAELNAPYGVATDASGNVYIADTGNNVVRKVAGGNITLFAGSYAAGYSGDGGPATAAKLNFPVSLTVDGSTNVFIADDNNGAIRKVAGGTITTAFPFANPQSVAVDSVGNLYIANAGNAWKVTPGGAISSIASVFTRGVAVGPGDRVLGASDATQQVYLFTATGPVVVAGTGATGVSGDGGPATAAELYYPVAAALDSAGDIFITDLHNQRIRRVQAYTAPSAPLAVNAIAGNSSATVSWTAPASNGGLTLTTYTVTPSVGPPILVSGSPPATTTVMSGLANGTPYTFAVTAANPWSVGPTSTPSNTVTPTVAPPGNIITYAGSVGAGAPTSIGQAPYSLSGNLGADLLIGDFANPVVRDANLSTGQESAFAGNDGYGYAGDGGPAAAAMIEEASAIAYCGGVTYFADRFNNVIRAVDSHGTITTFAGDGKPGYSGDGGPAAAAEFGRIFGLACGFDFILGGKLYVADSDNGAIRVIQNGTITTWASGLSFPTGISFDGNDFLDVALSGASQVIRISPSGSRELLAGTGVPGFSGDGGPATAAQLNDPRSVVYRNGDYFITDRSNQRIRRVDFAGNISTYAGDGVAGFSGDGGAPTSAALNYPTNLTIALDHTGTAALFVTDILNFRVREVSLYGTPTISTVAGNGTPSLSGDGGPATTAQLGNPYAVALDANGDLFVADNQNAVVRKVSPTGVITTVAGNGVPGYSGDGGLAVAAQLNDPRGVAVAGNGDLYISDTGNQRVRKVDHSTGIISTAAGTGVAGFLGDNGPAINAEINTPRAVAVDGNGNVYIADTGNNRVRSFIPGGTITTFAGTGVAGYSGDGAAATAANLNGPRGLAVDASSNVYIGDTANNRVRRVDHGTGTITTYAGNGQPGLTGDGHTATSAELNRPFGLAVDPTGNLYIADEFNQRIRLVDAHGIITSVVGACGTIAGFSGDGGPASIAQVNFPFGVAVDGAGDLYIADVDNNRVRAATRAVGLRGSTCPGPSGSAGSRSTNPSGSSSPPPRIVDSGGSSHKFANDTVLPDRVSSAPAQPTRVAPKQAPAQPAPVTKPGAAQPNPPAAQKPPAAGPAPARGRAPAPTGISSAAPQSWPRPDSAWWVLLVPVALLMVAMTLARRRSKSLKRDGR